MKKVMFVTRSMISGGTERVISQVANYLSQRGINCIIIALYKDDIFYKLDDSIQIVQYSVEASNPLQDKYMRYLKLRKLVKHEKPDLVLAMPEEIGIYVLLSLLGLKVPVVVSERNNPAIMPYKKATRILRKLMYPFAKGLIFQTSTARAFFSRSIQKRGVVLPNPVDAERIPLRYNGIRDKRIVAAGRLDKQKNFKLLIQAYHSFLNVNKDYSLEIYGEGPMRKELQQFVDELEIHDKVSLPGRSAILLEQIKKASMFVLSSDYEGSPNVLIEAMCMGMPVIATDCPSGGPGELIEDGYNGILISTGDVDGLKNAMIEMSNVEYANKLAANAYLLREKLTSKEVFAKWEEYLSDCCS